MQNSPKACCSKWNYHQTWQDAPIFETAPPLDSQNPRGNVPQSPPPSLLIHQRSEIPVGPTAQIGSRGEECPNARGFPLTGYSHFSGAKKL